MLIARLEVTGRVVASGQVCLMRAGSPDRAGRITEANALGDAAAVEIRFTLPEAKTRDFASITRLAPASIEKIKKARVQ